MILIDYNQMIIANFMQFQKHFEPGKENDVMRHMVLNNIKMIKTKKIEIQITCDTKEKHQSHT